MRTAHPRWGARRVQAELARRGIDPPAVSSIHQALRRNHLVAPQPPRRPKALKRFEREVSNDLWQIDATCVRLASRRKLLDGFRHHYNRERPHQGLQNLTPAERYRYAPPAAEAAASTGVDDRGEPVYPPHSIVRKVSSIGNVGYLGKQITVGKRWAGARVRVIPVNGLVHIFYGEELVRVLAVDPGSYHHPLGRRMLKVNAVR